MNASDGADAPRADAAVNIGILTAAAFLCYGGLNIAHLGFYRDDWAYLYKMIEAGSLPDVLRMGEAMQKKHDADMSKFTGESHNYSFKRPKRKVLSRYKR